MGCGGEGVASRAWRWKQTQQHTWIRFGERKLNSGDKSGRKLLSEDGHFGAGGGRGRGIWSPGTECGIQCNFCDFKVTVDSLPKPVCTNPSFRYSNPLYAQTSSVYGIRDLEMEVRVLWG